jgi:hypothetical protein
MSFDYNYNFDLMDSLWQFFSAWAFIGFLVGALMVVSLWFLFQKAGEPGWAAIVPIYNVYELFKISWGSGWYFLLLLIPLANFVIGIVTWVKLARAFGKGGGWACGLIFLLYVFLPITAFSKDIVYVGIPGKGPRYQPGYGPGSQQGYQQNGYQAPPQQNGYQQSAQNPEYFYQQSAAPSGSRFCSGCGEALESGVKFCPKCGKPQ